MIDIPPFQSINIHYLVLDEQLHLKLNLYNGYNEFKPKKKLMKIYTWQTKYMYGNKHKKNAKKEIIFIRFVLSLKPE